MFEEQIRRYSKEWTNFLPSDPGITILENLQLFQRRQLKEAAEISEEAREQLLRLLGYPLLAESVSAVLVENREKNYSGTAVRIEKCQKFLAGDICFEPEEETVLYPGVLSGIFSESAGRLCDHTDILTDRESEFMPFGAKPQAGDCLYLMFTGPPAGASERRCLLYVKCGPKQKGVVRNPWGKTTPRPSFARTVWSYLTEDGYEEMQCADDTGGFAAEGEIRLIFGDKSPIRGRLSGREGYLVCCRLAEAEYDVQSVVREIYGPLLRLCQRDTMAKVVDLGPGPCMHVPVLFPDDEQMTFFYLRHDWEEGYRECTTYGKEEPLRVPPEARGFVVCMGREAAIHRRLGVLGDAGAQSFDMSMFPGLLEESLWLDAAVSGDEGEVRHHFFSVKTGRDAGISCKYDRRTRTAAVTFDSAYAGARILLCGLAVSREGGGNIRGNLDFSVPGKPACRLYNPMPARGGRGRETAAEASLRMVGEMRTAESAVTEEDYEMHVLCTPGLCIHKVRADVRGRDVLLSVKPWGMEEMAGLPELYKKQLFFHLNKRRLLGMRVHIRGVRYLPLRVYVAVKIRRACREGRDEIERIIREELDDIHNKRRIGETISFSRIYGRLVALPGVMQIDELSVRPLAGGGQWVRPGEDILIDERDVCFVKELEIKMDEGGRL